MKTMATATIALMTPVLASASTATAAEPAPHADKTNASFVDFDARARAGERLTVAFFGGSLTWSANASEPNRTGFRGLVADWFVDEYPGAHFDFDDAAIGGTGSLLGIFRLDRDVLRKKPDLVFLDFSCNDGWNAQDPLSNLQAACAYESLLRRMTAEGIPVVQMFFTFKSWIADILDGKAPETVHRRLGPYLRLAEPYGTAIGDVYRDSSLLADIRSGKTLIDTIWPIDGGHPDDPGYRYFADAGIAGYRRAVKQGLSGRVPETPVYGTVENLRRLNASELSSMPGVPGIDKPGASTKPGARADAPAPWRRDLTFRTSLWYDGLSSRWMDDVFAFSGASRSPIRVRAVGNLFGVFGESDENALVAEIRSDGNSAAEFNGYHNAGKGRLFIWRHTVLDGWEDGRAVEHEFEIDPVPGSDGKGEFRIGAICTATLAPSDAGLGFFGSSKLTAESKGDDIEKLDHARGTK